MRFSYAETRQTKAVQALTSLWDFEKKKEKSRSLLQFTIWLNRKQ